MCVHILGYIAEKKTKTIDIVDSRQILQNISVKVRVEQPIKKTFLVRNGAVLPHHSIENGYVEITIPEIKGYDILAIDF